MAKRPFFKRLKRGIREILGMQVLDYPDPAKPVDPDSINVRNLLESTTVSQFNAAAEAYYSAIPNPDFQMSKPFADTNHTPRTLAELGLTLQGLELSAGMRILDFGCGCCGISRMLTQMHLRVICMDVSLTALKIGRTLFCKHPPVGQFAHPRFIVFDGHQIPLDDQSVDRILVFDVFHHVPDQKTVLAEFHRILTPGGIAGFCEPGPNHSRTPQSQSEMRTFKVLENDICIQEIQSHAESAGFDRMRVMGTPLEPWLVSPGQFDSFLDMNDLIVMDDFIRFTKSSLQELRLFCLYKAGNPALDSRNGSGLLANITVLETPPCPVRSETFGIRIRVTNTGSSTWLPSASLYGPVKIGIHLKTEYGEIIDFDYFRANLPERTHGIIPKDSFETTLIIPSPPTGHYQLELDLVAENITWFATTGSLPVLLPLEVFRNDPSTVDPF